MGRLIFRIKSKHQNFFAKSSNIEDLAEIILSNKKQEYFFLYDYNIISVDTFLKLYLSVTNNYKQYLKLFRFLKPPKKNKIYKTLMRPKTLHQYLNNEKTI